MRAVVLEVDERMIAERHRLGQDKRDEMWKGVLHMVPPASRRHQKLETALWAVLIPAAKAHGLDLQVETGVFAAADDYRVPDLVAFDETAASERGVDGAPVLVIEIRSPRDESDEKLPWYVERGTKEVLIVDRDSLALDLWRAGRRVAANEDGSLVLETLGVTIMPAGDTLLVDGAALDL